MTGVGPGSAQQPLAHREQPTALALLLGFCPASNLPAFEGGWHWSSGSSCRGTRARRGLSIASEQGCATVCVGEAGPPLAGDKERPLGARVVASPQEGCPDRGCCSSSWSSNPSALLLRCGLYPTRLPSEGLTPMPDLVLGPEKNKNLPITM